MSTAPFYFVFPTEDEAYAARPQFESEVGNIERKRALDYERRERESFDRCDTDGFLSQWAMTCGQRDSEARAKIADNAGLIVRPCLIDVATGEVVAVCVHVFPSRYQYNARDFAWKVHRSPGIGNSCEWVRDYKRESGFAQRGLRKAYMLAPGKFYRTRTTRASDCRRVRRRTLLALSDLASAIDETVADRYAAKGSMGHAYDPPASHFVDGAPGAAAQAQPDRRLDISEG